MDSYDEYEKECEEIRKENEEYLELFQESLKKLSPKTIRKHVDNVEFFLNEYLTREDALHMEEGMGEVSMFLGCYFIEKCTWSTPSSIRTYATSLKKFYRCMADHGKVEEKDYQDMCETIREEMPEWQEACGQFNEGDIEGYMRTSLGGEGLYDFLEEF